MGILSAGGAAALSPGNYSADPCPVTPIVGRDLFARALSNPPGESSTSPSPVAVPYGSRPAASC
jgi:hypothetical protein